MELKVDIIGENLAEVDFGPRGAGDGRTRLFLGIQKGDDIVDIVRCDGEQATFPAVFAVSPLPDGATNFLGPYAHGPRAARFCYLCWLAEEAAGQAPVRFARIKLPLGALRWETVEAAARAGTPVGMRFSLVGKGGGPVCASVPNESIQWET
jgi:hypothetical protein